ncbi:MAG: DinB family protein [Acidobacteriota bacterium]
MVTTVLSRGPCPSFWQLASRYLDEYLQKITVATQGLDDEQLWWRTSSDQNSIANLMLHLAGNLRLWIGQGQGGDAFDRDRAGEFNAEGDTGPRSRAELLAHLGAAVGRCREILESKEGEPLDMPLDIQGYSIDALGALFHAVEHMGYHTGQIVWIAKHLLGAGHGVEMYPPARRRVIRRAADSARPRLSRGRAAPSVDGAPVPTRVARPLPLARCRRGL